MIGLPGRKLKRILPHLSCVFLYHCQFVSSLHLFEKYKNLDLIFAISKFFIAMFKLKGCSLQKPESRKICLVSVIRHFEAAGEHFLQFETLESRL